MRPDAFARLACYIAENYLRRVDVPGVLKELLDEFRTAFDNAAAAKGLKHVIEF